MTSLSAGEDGLSVVTFAAIASHTRGHVSDNAFVNSAVNAGITHSGLGTTDGALADTGRASLAFVLRRRA